MACNLNGTYIEETQEHIFLCVNFSQNDSKFEISEKCFQTYLLMNGIQKTWKTFKSFDEKYENLRKSGKEKWNLKLNI